MTYLGLLKWYDKSKGFGVLSTLLPKKASTAEVFFHHSCWTGRSIDIKPFAFDVRRRMHKGGYEANHCSLFDCSIELWQLLFDNIGYNLYVISENGKKNLLQECVKMIQTSQDAANFIEVCKQWLASHPISKPSDFSDILIGGKYVKVHEFQAFLNSIIESFSFEEKIELFKNKQVGLYAFSDEECMQIIDLIVKDDYDTIIESNSCLYLKILREKLLFLVNSFSFKFESERNVYSYSKIKTEYETIEELYNDYLLCASDEQKKDLIEEIDKIIVNKEDKFKNTVNDLITNSRDALIFANKFKKLISFPTCISTNATQLLIKSIEGIIKEKYDFTSNLKLMSLGVIPIDTYYIEQFFHCVNSDNIQYIVQENTGFTSEYVCKTLFCYLEKTNDIDTTIQWYNKREDIQSIELTDKIKSSIKANFLKPEVLFISRASDYLLLLGNDFIYNVTKEYLQKTHKSEPLLKQLSHSKEGYREKLSSLLFSFHHDYRDLVDDNFVEPLCRYTYKDIHPLLTEDFIVEALEALVDNTKNYKNALFYAGKFSPEAKKRIENYLLSLLSNEEYMHLWEEELCNYLPDGYLDFYFDDEENKYTLVEQWLKKGRVTKENVVSAMVNTIHRVCDKTYYRFFRTEFLIYVFFKNNQCENEISSNIDSSKAVLFDWAINPTYSNFESICDTFILFPDSIQVKLLKYVFLIIAQGKLHINVDDLRKLNNCNSIYKNYSEQDKPVMCLSASVVIESLCSYAKEKKFITDKDFYKLVYENVAYGGNKIELIGGFFDRCSGKKKLRMVKSSRSLSHVKIS